MSFIVVDGLSHTDHVTPDVVSHIEALFQDRTGRFVETITLPDHLPEMDDALYGPINGDAPIGEDEVYYARRSGRASPSRLIDRPVRKTRKLTVVAGPRGGLPCVLVTVHGGPRRNSLLVETPSALTLERQQSTHPIGHPASGQILHCASGGTEVFERQVDAPVFEVGPHIANDVGQLQRDAKMQRVVHRSRTRAPKDPDADHPDR